MNKQKTLFITVFLVCLGLTGIHAQNAVLSSGGDAAGTGGSVAYSVGQIAYTTYDGTTGSISLGVQQPYVVIMVGTDEPDILLSAGIYPNPVNTSFNIRLEEHNPLISLKNISCELYDINGNLVLHQEIIGNMTTIPMENLTNAVYILHITQNNTEIKTFKIFKTN